MTEQEVPEAPRGGRERPRRTATAEQVEAAWSDTKLAQELYHDWEAGSYDDKWSISFDQRCVDYARDRFEAVGGRPAQPYGRSLEIGAGTGFFTLNLMLAGLVESGVVTDISEGMVEVALDHAAQLGLDVTGRVADAERLPFDDASFDLVVGHAVIHHLPDLRTAFAEMHRVLKPGGRLVVCGEPTKVGHTIARRLSTLTWHTTRAVTSRVPALSGWARPEQELDESSRAAALEAVVDLHTFDPDELAALVRESGLAGVRTHGDELLASWWGWPVRTFEAAVPEERLGWGWRSFAYRTWRALDRVDRRLARVVPQAVFYNVSVTGFRPR
ncbi:class I SAM-dependent methyltransferase [Desertihabitans brevis]|uniref:Class I SAM-dependent methyltransferase n=1 Tax=Desertihabitans brevis TaxID=2268447 RepID=A0A367Z1H7_9ACTN|nr:class I SAM-dependent methyltransferase [Desertihabitans brevis]RCK71081.1 class I SAM-dependent methyltransferase [Desertihabitans brevis]